MGWKLVEDNHLWKDDAEYVVNDALVDLRMNEKDGDQVQARMYKNTEWGEYMDVKMNQFPPTNNNSLQYHFRIKPSESEIDWSVVNDTDWFYREIKGEGVCKYLMCGLKDMGSAITFDHLYIFVCHTCFQNIDFTFLKQETKTFRLATSEEKQMVFEKYPELKPVEVGDFGFFWNGHKSRWIISQIALLPEGDGSSYKAIDGFYYKNFRRINPDKGTLREQVPELFNGENGEE